MSGKQQLSIKESIKQVKSRNMAYVPWSTKIPATLKSDIDEICKKEGLNKPQLLASIVHNYKHAE